MPDVNPPGAGGFGLVNPLGPALSYSAVRKVTDRAQGLLDQLLKKLASHIHGQLNEAGQVGANAEVKVLTPLAEKMTPAESLLAELVTNVQNDLAGKLAPAVAHLEALGHPIGAMPEMGKGLGQLPTPPPGGPRLAGDGSRIIQSGDASKGRSAGALSAKEQELGVDPAVEDSSRVVLAAQQPAAAPAQCADITQAQIDALGVQAQSAIDQLTAVGPADIYQLHFLRLPDGSCCILQASPDHPGNFPQGNYEFGAFTVTADDTRIGAAFRVALDGWPGSTDTCGPGGPVTAPGPPTPPPPTQPPTPIGSPPPPPPECCPPPVINVPPCPPPPSIPDCVKVEFCDWDKFCETLTNCLGAAQPTAAQVDDFLADWPQEDVSPDEPANFSDYLGSVADDYLSYNSLDDAITASTKLDPDMDQSSQLAVNPFGPDIPILG